MTPRPKRAFPSSQIPALHLCIIVAIETGILLLQMEILPLTFIEPSAQEFMEAIHDTDCTYQHKDNF